jgi:hypothetical protein
MKKPSSIRSHVKVLSSFVYPYQKIRPVFSLRAVIHEFFQKKLNYIKATKFFLYDPLTTNFIRLRRDYTVFKKTLSMEQLFRKTPRPLKYIDITSVEILSINKVKRSYNDGFITQRQQRHVL